MTKIQWTEATWNPVRGCSRVSSGCRNCYAERQAARGLPGMRFSDGSPLAVMRESGPRWTGRVELQEHMLDIPLRRKTPTMYFVNSMSDLFHEDLPDEAIDRIFAVMALCPQHTFQVLTKRAERMREWLDRMYMPDLIDRAIVALGRDTRPEFQWPLPNVWLGVSCEDQATADQRIPELLQTPAALRFVSAEPLLGPVDLESISQCMDDNSPEDGHCQRASEAGDTLECLRLLRHGAPGIDWVIVGGESGPGARPFDLAWARQIVAQCKAAGVACFVKQLGAKPIGLKLRDRKGGDMAEEEWPEDLRVRQMPEPSHSGGVLIGIAEHNS